MQLTHDWVVDSVADIFSHLSASFDKIIGHVVDGSSEARLHGQEQRELRIVIYHDIVLQGPSQTKWNHSVHHQNDGNLCY